MKKLVLCTSILFLISTPAFAFSETQRMAIQSAGDALRSLVVVMTLTGVEVARNRYELSPKSRRQKRQRMKSEDLTTVAGRAALQILNEPTVWFAFFSHIVASTTAGEPVVRLLNKALTQSVSRMFIFRFLQSGIATAIGMAGWEVGKELWLQARTMLNQNDYNRATHMKSLFEEYAISEVLQKRSVLRKIFANMINIVFHNPSLREAFFNSIWHSEIRTDSFAMRVIFTAGGSVIGSLIFPESPRIGAFILGVGSGVLQNFVLYNSDNLSP